MKLRNTKALKLLGGAAILVLAALANLPGQRAQVQRPDRGTPGAILINARFALNDRVSTEWSGTIEVAGGRLEKLEDRHFPFQPAQAAGQVVRPSRITGANTWEAHSLLTQPPALHVDLSPVMPAPRPVWPLGLLIYLSGDETTRVTLRFAKQEPVSFAIGDLSSVNTFHGGAVEAERLPRLHRVGGDAGEADHPSVAAAGDSLWMAWQEYRGGAERVMARRYAGGAWDEPQVVAGVDDCFKTAVAQAGDSRLWVVWAARSGVEWHLWGRALSDGRWGAPEKLSNTPGPNLHHRMVADSAGRLWLVWQGFTAGQSDIFLRLYEKGRWKPAERVSESAANDWEPSVAVGGDGRAWIVWDTYAPGVSGTGASYDVVARSYQNGAFSGVLPVAAGPRFEAHASVAVDGRGRAWIAWDESGENWGKDWGFLVKDRGIGLYMGRALGLAVIENGRVLEPDIEGRPGLDWRAAMPPAMDTNPSLPSLHADTSGRMWLLYRYLAGARTRVYDGWAANGGWETAALQLTGGARAVPLARSIGRLDGRAAATVTPIRWGGGLAVAYAGDHRPFLSGNVQDYGVYVSEVPAAAAGNLEVKLRDRRPPPVEPPQLSPHPREEADVERLRRYRATIGGKNYRIVRGDLHRHTDISADGIGDGSLLDLYRYALDAAAMDFIAVTDHGAGADQEYSWWRTQKSADLFLVAGGFTPLYGFERSLPYPNGHRNIVFARRGVRTLPSSPEERAGKEGAAKLYRYLRENAGIAFSHTIATDQGTDWRDNDPALEPLVEIYQGFRNSYEHEGAPKSAMAGRPYLFKSGYRPPGFYWNALAKGYKLGIQASSDHVSTHLSYTALYTTGLSRDELIEAMRERRAYGATDNILLDFRLVEAGGREHLMGSIVATAAPARLKVRAVGTSPIRRLDIIRNSRYIYTAEPAKTEVDVTFSDPEMPAGESWYYVRVLQHDGQVAWASPIWVTRRE